MDTIYSENYKGHEIKIMVDDSPESPREWDNAGTFVMWHNRYAFGDKHNYSSPSDFVESLAREVAGDTLYEKKENKFCHDFNWADGAEQKAIRNDFEKWQWAQIEKKYIVLPVYMYEHSGITIRTSKFSCPWDSGQIGYIYISKDKAKKEWGKGYADKATKYLDGEIQTLDDYLTGNVYGYVVEYEGNELESVWGFYPEHDGKKPYNYCLQEAKNSVDYFAKNRDTFEI